MYRANRPSKIPVLRSLSIKIIDGMLQKQAIIKILFIHPEPLDYPAASSEIQD